MTIDVRSPSPLRVRPTPWRGLLPYLSYAVVFYAMFVVVGTQYMRLGESAETFLSWAIPPVLAGLVVALFFCVTYGWWRPALTEERPVARWARFLPILVAVIAVANILLGDFSRTTPLKWIVVIAGCLIVGFNEEIINRGLLLVGLRSRLSETGVWLVTTTLFAAYHLPNVFFGSGWATLFQFFVSLGMGSLFYLTRRTTGSLVFAMLLHALWDTSGIGSTAPWLGLAGPLIGVTAIIVVIVVLSRERRAARSIPAQDA